MHCQTQEEFDKWMRLRNFETTSGSAEKLPVLQLITMQFPHSLASQNSLLKKLLEPFKRVCSLKVLLKVLFCLKAPKLTSKYKIE